MGKCGSILASHTSRRFGEPIHFEVIQSDLVLFVRLGVHLCPIGGLIHAELRMKECILRVLPDGCWLSASIEARDLETNDMRTDS